MRLEDVKGYVEWSALEEELFRCAPRGELAVLPDKDDCPVDTSDPARRVRAALIRWLLLGGDEAGGVRAHPKGVRLQGAWVDGALDLQNQSLKLGLDLKNCRFSDEVNFMDVDIPAFWLSGGYASKRINLHRMHVQKFLHISDGFCAPCGVDLGGARIGKGLSFNGINTTCSSDSNGENLCRYRETPLINCRNIVVGLDVHLCKPDERRANSTATIFSGTADFSGAVIEGDLIAESLQLKVDQSQTVPSLCLASARVKGKLVLQRIVASNGNFDLRHASLGVLRDDKGSWDGVGALHLDGLTYDRIDSAMTVQDRIAWLDRNRDGMKVPGTAFCRNPGLSLPRC